MDIPNESELTDYCDVRQQLDALGKDVQDVTNHPNYCLPFLTSGRLAKAKIPNSHSDSPYIDYGWGVVCNFRKIIPDKTALKESASLVKAPEYIVELLVATATEGLSSKPHQPISYSHAHGPSDTSSFPPPYIPGISVGKPQALILPIRLTCLNGLSTLKIYLPKNLKDADQRETALKTLNEIKKRFSGIIPLLDPINDMHIQDEKFKNLIKVRIRW